MAHTGGIMGSQPNKEVGEHICQTFFNDDRKGVFIEAGATDGIAGSVCYILEEKYGWTGINIEANPYWIADLKLKRPDCLNLHNALWSKDCTKIITLPQYKEGFKYPGGASLVFWDETKLKDFVSYEEHSVEAITYHTLCEKNNITKVDLFVLDVEGAELEVLDGIEEGDPLPEIFYIEKDKVYKYELDRKMEELGYEMVESDKNNSTYKGSDVS